jgi:pentatricopeptide repeat protein
VGYFNEGLYGHAQKVFDEMTTTEKDIVTHNAMIVGYSKLTERAKNSLKIYKSMHCLGFRPKTSKFC